jgi:hypothetical protein
MNSMGRELSIASSWSLVSLSIMRPDMMMTSIASGSVGKDG